MMRKKIVEKYRVQFEQLKNGDHFYRLGKLFQTKNKNYFYDMGTGKIFELKNEVYELLYYIFKMDTIDGIDELHLSDEELEKGLEEIVAAKGDEHILSAPKLTEFVGPQSLALREELDSNMSQLTLEVTESCNLRCKYCIYQDSHNDFHGYVNRNMTFEIAKKAIDFAYPRIGKHFYIAFYGGEPLLNYTLITQVVKYAKKSVKEKELGFSLTTNGVLITDEIAEFFAKNDFVILVSLDGPEDIHNENRVFADGRGSFKLATEGLKKLLKAYGNKYKSNIFISMVTSGPNYAEKYDKIQKFFVETDWLPSDISVNASYVSYGRYAEEYVMPNLEMDEEYAEKNIDPLVDWSIANHGENAGKERLFSKAQIQKNLHIVHRREIYEKPMGTYFFNGCCVPGARRMHVNVEGKFLPCERVGTVPYLGDVNNGFDYDCIKKYYVQDFMEEAVEYCKHCWAVHMCSSCYIDCFDDDKINMSYRHSGCKYIRYNLQKALEQYHSILESNPDELEPLNHIVIE